MATKKLQVIGGFGPGINDSTINTDSVWSSKNTVDRLCPAFTESGNVVTCTPVEGYPLEVVTQITPVQSGSGDPSPENIRPISGHTQVKMYHGGKNLIPNRYIHGKALGASGGKIVIYGSAGRCYVSDILLQPGTYTLSGPTDTAYMAVYDAEFNHNNAIVGLNGITLPHIFTISEPAYFGLHCEIAYENMYQLEWGSVDTNYEPYRGKELTLDLGQTVYGGSLDWKTGVLTVDKQITALTGGENWQQHASTPHLQLKGYLNWGLNHTTGLCSHYKVYQDVYPETFSYIRLNTGAASVWYEGFGGEYSDVDEFKDFLAEQYAAGTPVQVCYQLATPITVQLTPTEILALSGVNTLYSDCGNTTVTGKTDITAVVEQLTNAIIALGGNV